MAFTFSRTARIITLLIIDVIFFFVELIVGYAIGSLALVADSFHMLNDIVSLIVALYAIKLSKNIANAKYSYGWHRAEVLAALVNGVFLLALCFSIFLEAIERFFSNPDISNPKLIVIVGSLGLLSNFVGLFLFNEHPGHDHGPSGEQAHDDHDHADGHEHAHAPVAPTSERSPLVRYEGLPQSPLSAPRARSSSFTSTIFQHPAVAQRALVMEEAEVIQRAKSPEGRRHNSTGSLLSPSRTRTQSSATDINNPPSILEMEDDIAGPDHAHDDDEHEEAHTPTQESHAHAHGHNHAHPHSHGHTHNYTHTHDHHHSHVEIEPDVDDGELGPDLERGNVHDHAAFAKEKNKKGGGHGGHSHGNMNMRALILHVMGDALGNVGVIATGLIIWLADFKGKYYFDPAISLVITCIIFSSAMPLVRSASVILLQAVPTDVSLDDVRDAVLAVPGVLAIHELHVWQLSETRFVASVHVWVSKGKEYMQVAAAIRKEFHDHGIHSCTIQPEFHPEIDEDQIKTKQDTNCLIACDEEACEDALCCPPVAPIANGNGNAAVEPTHGNEPIL